MPPPRALRRVGPRGRPLRRVMPPAVVLAVLALLAPEWSGAAAIPIAALVWRRHHGEPSERRRLADPRRWR